MLKHKVVVYLFILCCFSTSFAANGNRSKMTIEQYIEQYKEDAIIEMKKFNIPASITLAQAIIESANGNSDLAVNANNHFGIKCHKNWTGSTYIKDDDKKDECFRKYESVLDSYTDHSSFLTSYSRYASLFQLKTTDYKGWAKGLKQTGYATNPNYDNVLINLIEKFELYKLDSDIDIKKGTSVKTQSETGTTKSENKHQIYRLGFKKYIIIKPNDAIEQIAIETDKDLWQLYKYNDLSKNENLIAGQKLFLQPKRNKAKEPTHLVKQGETMKFISQLYGVKLTKLYHKNNMKQGEEPKAGELIYLRKNKPTDSFE